MYRCIDVCVCFIKSSNGWFLTLCACVKICFTTRWPALNESSSLIHIWQTALCQFMRCLKHLYCKATSTHPGFLDLAGLIEIKTPVWDKRLHDAVLSTASLSASGSVHVHTKSLLHIILFPHKISCGQHGAIRDNINNIRASNLNM